LKFSAVFKRRYATRFSLLELIRGLKTHGYCHLVAPRPKLRARRKESGCRPPGPGGNERFLPHKKAPRPAARNRNPQS